MKCSCHFSARVIHWAFVIASLLHFKMYQEVVIWEGKLLSKHILCS